MRWMLELNSNKSSGRVKITEVMDGLRVKWSDDIQSEFQKLGELEKVFGFQWTEVKAAPTVKKPERTTQIFAKFPEDAPKVLVDLLGLGSLEEKKSCVKILGSCLAKIAEYAKSKDTKAGTGRRPLGTGGKLEVYFLRPAKWGANGRGCEFRRLCFALSLPSQKEKVVIWAIRSVDGLVITKPVSEWNLKNITQVDPKVWIFTGKSGEVEEKAAVKIEVTQDLARHDCTVYLAGKMFESAPDRRPLTQADTTWITEKVPLKIKNKEVRQKQEAKFTDGEPVTGAAFDNLTTEMNVNGSLCLKIEYMDPGGHLLQRISQANTDNLREALNQYLFSSESVTLFKIFGRIAAFDLVVSNDDRFRPIQEKTVTYKKKTIKQEQKDGLTEAQRKVLDEQGSVKIKWIQVDSNLKNFDFNAGNCPVALDNFEPNRSVTLNASGIESDWKDVRPIFEVLTKRIEFSTFFLADLIEKAKAEEFFGKLPSKGADRRRELEFAFLQGVENGAKHLQAILPQFKEQATKRKWGDPADEMIRRIKVIKV